jgi:hypothetical protein
MVHVGELGLQVRLVRSTHAGAARVEGGAVGLAELDVAGLGHEALDHPVKHDAVIGALTGQLLDAGDVVRAPDRAAARWSRWPCVVSMMSVFSGSLISAMGCLLCLNGDRCLRQPPERTLIMRSGSLDRASVAGRRRA